jgi:WD repeat-containing protein 81
VQKLIAQLAPAVSISPVSFEQLIHDVEKFQNHDEEVSTGSSVEEVRAELPLIASAISTREHTTLEELLRSADARHPNLVPLIGAYKGEGVIYLLFPPAPVSLESLLHFSPSALRSEDHIRLLLFEILSSLAHCHSLQVNHGNLRPWNVLIRDSTWCWLTGFGKSLPQGQAVKREECTERILVSSLAEKTELNCISDRGGLINLDSVHSTCNLESEYSISAGGSLVDYKGSSLLAEARLSKNKDWRVVFKRWWAGELSNYDYLLFLNKLAGRRWGDRCFHTVMPWVIDFSAKPDAGYILRL